MTQIFDSTIKALIKDKLDALERHFKADCIFYYGQIYSGIQFDSVFKDFIESIAQDNTKDSKKLCIFLNTTGGSVETVEKMVKIIRHHYGEVYFIVPNQAMSAGTIFCMSGNKIYMDYASSLGPIDPQVLNKDNKFVPALGYLDEVEAMIQKSLDNKLSNAEFLILQNQDLATLNRYKQARELTIKLLKEWLASYKFQTWKTHKRNGSPVTEQEKKNRAAEIAQKLSDNKLWHTHARMIDIKMLKEELKLEIEDYSDEKDLKSLIKEYNELVLEYIQRSDFPFFLHSRKHI